MMLYTIPVTGYIARAWPGYRWPTWFQWPAAPFGILTTSTCEITFDKKCSVLLDQKISISCFLIPLHFTNIFKAINFLKIHTWIVFLFCLFSLNLYRNTYLVFVIWVPKVYYMNKYSTVSLLKYIPTQQNTSVHR